MSDLGEVREEEPEEEDDLIATHPRAKLLLEKQKSLEQEAAEDDGDDHHAADMSIHRKRRRPGSKKFEAVGGFMTARRSRTFSSGSLPPTMRVGSAGMTRLWILFCS